MNQTVSQDQYFATLQDPVDLASAMEEKISSWRNWCQSKGLLGLWSKKLRNYYGNSTNGNSSQGVNSGGSEGELSLIKVNDLRRLIQEQLVLVTSQRPAGIARAVNSDSKSLKAARIGTAIAEYYLTNADSDFEAKFVSATEIALLCDEAFTELFWDKEAGEPIAVDPEKGTPIMSGDAVLRIHAPWNVARDPGAPCKSQTWAILTFPMNRFDAAATYPKFQTQILGAANDSIPGIDIASLPEDSDMIWAHLLVHDRTASVPEGRYSLMIAQQIVVDTDLPYKEYPVERISPSDVIDGPTGYTSANDVMALEEVTDALHSIITSNNVTFGGQSLVGPQGGNISVSDLGKGLRLFELPADMVDKLKPLQLTKSAPETYNYAQTLTQKKEGLLGSVQGTISQQASQGASGSAMALVQAQAVQYNSGVQRSYFRLLSSSMTKLIGVLQKYADSPRVARIVGKSRASSLKEFKYTGKDLNSISSIVYEMTNPISQTVGGRLAMGQDLIKAGMIKSPKQYITLLTTGSLDALTENDEADELLIIEENEALSEGRQVQAVITEIHADHIKAHMSVLSSVTAKDDPQLISTVLDHIQQHIALWTQASQTNPGILMATGQQPLMPPPPPGMGMPPGPGGPHLGAPQGPGKVMGGGEPPQMKEADQVRKPEMPKNPVTNERVPAPAPQV